MLSVPDLAIPAYAIEFKFMVCDPVTVLLCYSLLQFFNPVVFKLDDLCASGTDQMVVVFILDR
jgi:hypothetical protein